MKLQKRKIGIAIAFLVVFILGGVVGLFGASYLYHKQVFPYMEMNDVSNLYHQIDMVSYLHLKETDKVIALLDADIDRNILAVSSHGYIEADCQNRVMGFAKAYREICPSNPKNASEVLNTLKEFPKIELEKVRCKGGLCRLAKQVQSGLGDK
ncbi:MAG: hypothetical protein ACYTFM_04675 [Planctomycetota bacterium]|jgi:hypothetical protein